MNYVKYILKIPWKLHKKVEEVLSVLHEETSKYNGRFYILDRNKRLVKYIIEIPETMIYEKNIISKIEDSIIKRLNLPRKRVYIEPYRGKAITRYIKEKYKPIFVKKEVHEELKKLSKDRNMTISEFIQYLIDLYKQLKNISDKKTD